MQETTTIGLQERQDAPLILNSSEELFNFMNQNTPNHRDDSKIGWLSHAFKTSIPPPIKLSGLLEVT